MRLTVSRPTPVWSEKSCCVSPEKDRKTMSQRERVRISGIRISGEPPSYLGDRSVIRAGDKSSFKKAETDIWKLAAIQLKVFNVGFAFALFKLRVVLSEI